MCFSGQPSGGVSVQRYRICHIFMYVCIFSETMQQLNLPASELKVRNTNGKNEVFDSIRRRYVALTPEEWVRQHFIGYLVHGRNVPSSLISVESSLKYNRLNKRSDIVVYNN